MSKEALARIQAVAYKWPYYCTWHRGRAGLELPCEKRRMAGPNKQVSLMHKSDKDMDIFTQAAALRVSPSVVVLRSYSGDEEKFWGSGVVISCEENNDAVGTFSCTILTSASVLKTEEGHILDNIKVLVILPDGGALDASILACNHHYNVACMKIQSDCPLPIANLRLAPHLEYKELVIVVGRFFTVPHWLMACQGKFSIGCAGLDCKELFKVSCKVSRSCIGEPVIDRRGSVVGLAFHMEYCTPFLPISLAVKWIQNVKEGRVFCPPRHGMAMSNFCRTNSVFPDHVKQKFPGVVEGVVVDKVIAGSPAEAAGIRTKDVIVQCNNRKVLNLLEFTELTWDAAGKSIELVVLRAGDLSIVQLILSFEETPPDKFNRWPLPKLRQIRMKGSPRTEILEEVWYG